MSTAMPRAFSLPPDLRQRAWKALVKELGIVDATRFVMAVEPGEGDSLEKYARAVGRDDARSGAPRDSAGQRAGWSRTLAATSARCPTEPSRREQGK